MKKRSLILLAVFAMVLVGCGVQAPSDEPTPMPTPVPTPVPAMEEPESNTIVDIAVADGRFTTLVAALGATELDQALMGEGPFTVFAPTDEAFGLLPEGTVEALLEDLDTLSNILLYHVVAGEVLAADVVGLDGEMVAALSGAELAVSVEGDTVMINESNVIITDIQADNGVIHVIDAVLLPPSEEAMEEMESNTIVDIAVADGRFTTLVAALGATELDQALMGEGPFTVFAPTDEAFALLPEGTVEALLEDLDTLSSILLYHVVEGQVMAADVVGLDGEKVAALSGAELAIKVDGDTVMVNESNVIITDIEADNGVIHVIDAVLLPPSEEAMEETESNTIVDIAVADGRFTTLVAALGATELDEALMGEGPFTVFAPTDEAFDLLPEGTVEGLLEDLDTLSDILLYHVVEGRVMAADVVGLAGQMVATLSGEELQVALDGDTVQINHVNVIITDIEADNGVIHVIEGVLLPPEM